MPCIARLLILAASLVLLAGCQQAVKPDLPASTIVKPEIVYVPRNVFVPIRPELTTPLPIAEGPLSQCPIVAADRKAALLKANAQLGQIGAIQGTEVGK